MTLDDQEQNQHAHLMKNYDEHTVKELRYECLKRNYSANGTKRELVSRLLSDDKGKARAKAADDKAVQKAAKGKDEQAPEKSDNQVLPAVLPTASTPPAADDNPAEIPTSAEESEASSVPESKKVMSALARIKAAGKNVPDKSVVKHCTEMLKQGGTVMTLEDGHTIYTFKPDSPAQRDKLKGVAHARGTSVMFCWNDDA